MDNKRRKTPSTPSKTPKRLPKRKRTAQTSVSAKRALSTSSSPAIELRQRELKLYKSGQAKCIVGCDEAGRGPLVGLNPFLYIPQLLLTRTNFSFFSFVLLLIDVHRHLLYRHLLYLLNTAFTIHSTYGLLRQCCWQRLDFYNY